MADSYLLRGDKVVPYSGGRLNTSTDSWRDATDLEIKQAKEIKKLDITINRIRGLLYTITQEFDDYLCQKKCGCGHPACRFCRDDKYGEDIITKCKHYLEEND